MGNRPDGIASRAGSQSPSITQPGGISMRLRRTSLLLASIGAIAIAAPPAVQSQPRTQIHLALSDILRCSPTAQPEPGQFERVGFRSTASDLTLPVDIYDPGDCARTNEDVAAIASVPRGKA
jgi:hypothetical protein